MVAETLSIWTIYERPKDYPDSFVARRWELDKPTGDIIITRTLESMRRAMRFRGLTKLDRLEGDDPVIVETWM